MTTTAHGHSIVVGVGFLTGGFLTGGLRLPAVLVGGLQVLASGATVSLGKLAGQRFRSRLMFLSEHFMHQGYFILAQGF
jgi:hypothetical protein